MLRQLSELETILQQLIAEHRKLLVHVDAQQSAMRKLDLGAMDVAVNAQEACRLRIATLETKRRGLVLMLGRAGAGAAGGTGSRGAGGNVGSTALTAGGANARSPLTTSDQQRATPPVTLSHLAALYPQRREPLLKLGSELKQLATQIASRSRVAGRLAGAVLGHLNTVVRLLAGAVDSRANVYTTDGVPRVSSRIGVMEAVA